VLEQHSWGFWGSDVKNMGRSGLLMDGFLFNLRELNEAYGRLEEEYNMLRSNWEWFIGENSFKDPVYEILVRVEQN